MWTISFIVVIILCSVQLSVAPPGHDHGPHEDGCVHDDISYMRTNDTFPLAAPSCLHILEYIHSTKEIRFKVKACKDFRLILTEGKNPLGHQTHILIGTHSNTRTCFAHEDSNECEGHHHEYFSGVLLSCNTFKSFWLRIHVHHDDIELGYGDFPGHSTLIKKGEIHRPSYMAVRTSTNSNDVFSLNTTPVPVNGGWDTWSHWSSCSQTCGTGVRTKHRSCTKPKPQNGGKNCTGSEYYNSSCHHHSQCPTVNGAWANWGSWGSCSHTCGAGIRQRHRTCTSPAPENGGRDCTGSQDDTSSCYLHAHCAIDGGWSAWKLSTSCSASCNGGHQTWTRTCDSPRPEYGGRQCSGSSHKTETCNATPCPVEGGWGAWTTVMSCSRTCGGGTMVQKRLCNDPAPSHGGRTCVGLMEEVTTCNTQPCTNASALSSQTSTAPTPSGPVCKDVSPDCNNGDALHRICNSSSTLQFCTKSCGMCPVDGGWSQWKDSGCSQTCGGGFIAKVRKCNNPAPVHGGRNCTGQSFSLEDCNKNPCPVDGGWGSWSVVSGCSRTCGGGTRVKARLCSNPASAHGGKVCVGPEEMVELCNTQKC